MPWSNAHHELRTSPKTGVAWPIWATAVKAMADESDGGVGDTLRRLFAKVGGEEFKRTAKLLGVPCGCAARQTEYNLRYPY